MDSDMPLTADDIRNKILAALPDAQVSVDDMTGGGDHWSVGVVSPAFRGQGPVDRHRMVYAALGTAMNGPIHALALTTRAPEEP
jgi:stress-induced morphogen